MNRSDSESEKLSRTREMVVEEIRRQGNENLAETIANKPVEKLTDKNYIEGLIDLHPEYKSDINEIHNEFRKIKKEDIGASNTEQYFENVQGQRTFRNNWLAKDIEKKYQFRYIEDTERFYVFNGKIWEENATRIIEEECNKILGDEYTPNRKNKVVDTIKTRSNIRTTKREFRPSKNRIPFKNGTYDLEKGELEEGNFEPEDNFTHIINYKYDPNAQCPEIHDFLNTILENERDKETILETIGYSMLADYPYGHALMLFGSGKNGKSVLLEVWKTLLSEENYKEEKLQELENSRFATQSLYRKLAVFNDDLPGTKLKSGSTLKSLTGGGEVRAEYKNGAHFQFKNYATPVFACNEIPETSDQSDGFFRRWEIINFPYKFVEEPKRDFEKEKLPKDQLVETLTSEQEIKGLINEAIVCLELMKEQGGFTYKTGADDTRTLWKSYSSPVEQFLEVCIEQGLTQHDARELDESELASDLSEYEYDFIKKDDLVFLIDKYCQHFDAKAPSKTAITQKLKNETPYYVQEGRTRQLGSDDSRERVYKYIKFTDEFVDFILNKQKRPECPYFFENLRVHARNIVQSYQKRQDTEDTVSLGKKIKDFIDSRGEEVEEQKIIEEIDEPEEKVDQAVQELLNDGEIFRSRPGVVQKL